MPSRVSSIHDLESGEEFERIKQNFRSTVIAPDVTGECVFCSLFGGTCRQKLNIEPWSLADFPETQDAFEELQFELQEFLTQHISKVSALQGRIASNAPQPQTRHSNGEARVSQGTGMRL